MTKIGYIIEGEPVPDDVTRVKDRQGDMWSRVGADRWQCDKADIGSSIDGENLVFEWGPLAVTAVREPEPDPLLDVTSRREPGRSTETIRCPECGCTAEQSSLCTDEWHSAVEPQRADASALLDLVRQYGAAKETTGCEVTRGGTEVAMRYAATSDALFDRIAALDTGQRNMVVYLGAQREAAEETASELRGRLHEARAEIDRIAALEPQQPVQARNDRGSPWWIHECGGARTGLEPPSDHHCDVPGPWSPLLVGGEPTQAQGGLEAVLSADEEQLLRYVRVIEHQAAELQRGLSDAARQSDPLAVTGDLIAERDEARSETADYAARLKATDARWSEVARERDEARAEVERLKGVVEFLNAEAERVTDALVKARDEIERLRSDLTEEIGHREESDEWADRLASAIAAHLGVDIGEHSSANLPWQAALIALAETKPADPLVLSLPTVPGGPRVFEVPTSPRGVTRVGDSQGEVWALDSDDGLWHCDEQGWSPLPWRLLLADHGPLTDATPPREPRTWPKLDSAPGDLSKVRGKSGMVYVRSAVVTSYPAFVAEHNAGSDGEFRLARALSHWQETDGPLTEVFDDEPGGGA